MDRVLILMRHGAYDARQGNLSPTGQQQVDSVARQIANSDMMPDLVLHSPVPRAAESARRVCEIFHSRGKKPALRQEPWLDERTFTSFEHLATLPADKSCILLLTHQANITGLTEIFDDGRSAVYAGAYAYNQPGPDWKRYLSPLPVKQWQPGL